MLRKPFVSVFIRLRVKARENPFRFEMMYRSRENPTTVNYDINKSFYGGSRGALIGRPCQGLFSKRAPLAAGGKTGKLQEARCLKITRRQI